MPCFIASLALSFAIGTALPTRAYADVVDLVEGWSSLQFRVMNVTDTPSVNDVITSGSVVINKTSVGNSESLVNFETDGYINASQGGAISLAGTVNQNNGATSLTGAYTDTRHGVDIDTSGGFSTEYTFNELFRTKNMSLSGISQGTYMDIYIRFGETMMKAGDTFKLILPNQFMWEYSDDGQRWSTYTSSFANVHVWGSNSTANGGYELTKDSFGYYHVEGNTSLLHIVFRASNVTGLSSERLNKPYTRFSFYNPLKVLFTLRDQQIDDLQTQTIYNTTQINNKITQQTQQQTSELKDTTGSDSVISGTDGVTQQIQSKLGFIAETATITSNLYDAILYEGTGYVPFPEIAWQGQTIIAAQNVPILGYIPSIEDDIKTFNTIVLFLAWLHGMHSLYARIFLGQVEVISEDD